MKYWQWQKVSQMFTEGAELLKMWPYWRVSISQGCTMEMPVVIRTGACRVLLFGWSTWVIVVFTVFILYFKAMGPNKGVYV